MILRLHILVLILGMAIKPKEAKASFGAEIPFLIEIVANTLYTLYEIREQTGLLQSELRGIDDKIFRLRAIQSLIAPNDLGNWKDPNEALMRLQKIYFTLPPEFRTQKSDEIEQRLSQAMSVASILVDTAKPAFESGKELENNALDVGPAVANKMTASGVGSLVTLQAQNQVAQAQIISLLSQMIAENGSREATRLKSQSKELKSMGKGLRGFSKQIRLMEVHR